MEITFKNCGNINFALLKITKNKINIKYGLNGIGKTTLGKCLFATINSDETLIKRYITHGTANIPEVNLNSLTSCLYFDNDYINNYLLQEDLLNGSFEIIVKTPDYEKSRIAVEKLFTDLLNEINEEIILSTSQDLQNIVNSIRFTTKNVLDGKTSFAKGLKKINPDFFVDPKIIMYRNLIISPNNHAWIEWFRNGFSYIDENKCPFCVSTLHESFNERFGHITNVFLKNELKNSAESNKTLNSFKKYTDLSISKQITLEQQLGNISNETKDLIQSIIIKLNDEMIKIESIRQVDFLSLLSLSKTELTTKIDSYKLDENLFNNYSIDLGAKIKSINNKLKNLIIQIDNLNNLLGQLRAELSKNIKKASSFVNDFLETAGIPYLIEVEASSQDSVRTILRPINITPKIEIKKEALSFGELNSLSLVLFCVEAISKSYDLIILDDPVSSFDGNKKYAIMHRLFSSKTKENLRRKTVLILTHDFTPVIDFIYNGLPTQGEAEAYYVYNKSGTLFETSIEKKDIINCFSDELESAKNPVNNKIRRVVSLRNYYGMIKMDGSFQYSILSSLLHVKKIPEKMGGVPFNSDELESALSDIRGYINDFDYNNYFMEFSDLIKLKHNFISGSSIDKVCATRLLLTIKPTLQRDKVLWKFLNENYHLQNTLLFGLNSKGFELIPEYILKSCEELFNSIESSQQDFSKNT